MTIIPSLLSTLLFCVLRKFNLQVVVKLLLVVYFFSFLMNFHEFLFDFYAFFLSAGGRLVRSVRPPDNFFPNIVSLKVGSTTKSQAERFSQEFRNPNETAAHDIDIVSLKLDRILIITAKQHQRFPKVTSIDIQWHGYIATCDKRARPLHFSR